MIRYADDSSGGLLPAVALPDPGAATPSSTDLIAWAHANMRDLITRLSRHGAILFRGFAFDGPAAFERFASLFCDVLGSYVGGNTPRSRVEGNVFTTTEYSKNEKISLHNEASYLRVMPRRILFFCETAPIDRGQTPLADSRRMYARLRPEVRDRFAAKRVRYVNNLHDGRGGVGRSWSDAFQTSDRREVEKRLDESGYEYEWKPDGGLRTAIVADGVVRHPHTNELVWINQAEQWHPSSLNPRLRHALSAVMREHEFPHHATFGDGSPLDEADLAHIREVMAEEERVFRWNPHDVLLCDNFLVMHGRQPFTGRRRILAAMG